MFTIHDILGGYILPAAIILAGVWAIRRRFGASLSGIYLAWVPVCAFVLGDWQLNGWPGWAPADATRWFIHLALLSGVVAMITKPIAFRWLGELLLAALLPTLLLQPMIHYDWSTPVAVAWVVGYAFMILLEMGLLSHAARHTSTSCLFLILTMVTGATTLTMSLSGSLSLGKTCGVLATALLTAWLMSPWLPKTGIVTTWVPLTAVVTSGMWLSGLTYADLDKINAVLLYSSVPIAWLALRFKPTRSLSEKSVVGQRASGFVTGKDGESGDIAAYRRYPAVLPETQTSRKTSRSKPDRILRQAPRRPRWQQFALPILLTALPLAIAFARALLHFIHNETSGY